MSLRRRPESVIRQYLDSGPMVGQVYAANTVGAILGSLAFSMLVIPQVGTQWGQRLVIKLAALSALLAFAPFFKSRKIERKKIGKAAPSLVISKGKLAGALLSLAAIILLVILVSPLTWVAVAFGRFSYAWMPDIVPGIAQEKYMPIVSRPSEIRYSLYVGEGMNVSVAGAPVRVGQDKP